MARRQRDAEQGAAQVDEPGFSGRPLVVNLKHGEHITLTIPQRHTTAHRDRGCTLSPDLERHGSRPKGHAIRQPQPLPHGLHLRLSHIARQGRIGAVQQHFEFCRLAPVEVEGRQAQSLLAQLGRHRRVGQQRLERIAVRRNKGLHGHVPQG